MGMITSLPWKPIRGHSYSHVMGNILSYEQAFSARYEAAYMWFYVQSVRNEISDKSDHQKWQLDQRKWDSYSKPLKKGTLYVLGKSDGRKWKKRYCVLQADYSLEIYKSEEDYKNFVKPKKSAKYSGHVVAGDVEGYLHEQLEIASRDLGYVNADINDFGKKVTLIGTAGSRPTQHVLLVDHPWRGKTYFAAETAVEKDQWLRVFTDSIRHLEGCQSSDEIVREAFAFAVEQSVRLQEFYVDRSMLSGTQQEILTDLISAFQSVDCKEVVLPKITGGIVNKYKAWNFVLRSIHGIINGVVSKQYIAWKNVWEERCQAKRQQIIVNLPQINIAYEYASKVIRASLAECFDPIVRNDIIPHLPEVINVMSDSLVTPIRTTRRLFKTLVETVQNRILKSTKFAKNIDILFLHHLDFAPRNPLFTCPTGETSTHAKAAISFLQSVFPKTDFSVHLKSVYTFQQQILDAAVYTFETICGNSINKDDGTISQEAVEKAQNRVLKKLDYDILLAQKRFFRMILLSATMEKARESIEQHCKPKMLEFHATIPDELKPYLPINNVFTDVLTKRFGELIYPGLTSCMKQLSGDVLAVYSPKPAGGGGSLSSFATIDSEDGLSKLHEMDFTTTRNSLGDVTRSPNKKCSAPVADADDVVPSTSTAAQQPPEEPIPDQSRRNAESGECFSGIMDGETGEWFPPVAPAPVRKEETNHARDEDEMRKENDSDETSGDESDEFSERKSQQYVREILSTYPDSELAELGRDQQTNPQFSVRPCSAFVAENDQNLRGTANGSNAFVRKIVCRNNCSSVKTETGEPAPCTCEQLPENKCNGAAVHHGMNNFIATTT